MSRKKPKTSLVNLLRNKKTAIAAALCVVIAMGAYVGVHMMSSRAGTDDVVLRGTINDIEELKGHKSGASRSFGTEGNAIGSPTNPFVILDIVPWQGYGEMSYMVSGCQPANLYKTYTGTSMQGLNAMNMGLAVPYAFPEENYPGKDTDGDGKQDEKAQKEFGDVVLPWTLSGNEMTLYGYYEKVRGTDKTYFPDYYTPQFVIDGVEYDDNEGKYVPKFRKKNDGEDAEYFWVTLGNSENSIYKNHKKKENKSFNADDTAATADNKMITGDRFYTSRTGKAYCMGSMPQETCKYYHADDFLRYSVRIREQYQVDNYSVVVKTIEPWELNEHPEWLDYADLMYIHASNEYGASVQFYSTAKEKDPNGTEGYLYIDPKKSKNKNGATFGRHKFGDNGEDYADKQNDITFEVALKLFKKCNKFDEYNGSQISSFDGNLKMNYAPIIIGSTLYQSNYMDGINDSPTRMLEWETMTPAKNGSVFGTAYNNNVYKFCLMDLLMDQTVFYNNFIRTRVSTGKSVVQIRDDGEGIAEPHEGKAQLYWNIQTFMPYNDNVGHWRAFKDKYQLKTDKAATTAPYYDGNQGVNNFSYVYNNNGKIYYLAGEDDIQQNDSTDQVFGFYDDEGEHKDTVSTQDIIYYMLHYDKSDTGANGKDGKIEILDIEPCSDFTKMNIDYLLLLFPPSKEYMFTEDDFNLTHMTTSEFNGSKEDLTKYDMVYFGNSTGKMNATSGQQSMQNMSGEWVNMTYTAPLYNDDNDKDKIFLHVGDLIKGNNAQYRLSGNDVTSLRADALEKFVKSGKALVLPDILYMGNTSNNPLFSKAVGSGTNTESFLDKVRKKDNVYALSALTTSNVINFGSRGASVDITGTPPSYNNPTGDTTVKDENGNDSNAVSLGAIEPDKDGNYNLTFTFRIGYTSNKDEKYAVRLLIDKNGDGIISENETGADILDTWNSTVSAGQTFAPGTLNDEGEEQPAEYTVSYTIPAEQTNGPIAWKFIVYSTLNDSVYYEVSGISLYKGETNADGEAVVHDVRVLQIVSDGKDKTNANLESNNELFKTFSKLKDYTITVETITLSEYLKRFEEVNKGSSTGDDSDRTLFAQGDKEFYYPVEFMDYSIMLYSCGSDLQNASNANGAVSFAAWVSNNDKSVVYTNNSITASGSNAANRNIMKDAAGLSRFSSSDGTTNRYNDTATDASGKKYSAGDYESLEYTYYKATLGGTNTNKFLAYNNELWKRVDGNTAMAYNAGNQVSTKGSRSNLGTVCIYPYTIGEDLSLTGAQAQDYQLNLEIPDADVWYCLGDHQGRGNAAGKLNSYYAMSPNDAANNYYLYNVDSVFYDAIDLEKTTVEQEMKLFINVLVGAYEFSYGTPYVTVDRVTQIDGTEEELKEDSITTKERKYSFKVTAGEEFVKTTLYKEYLKNEKDKVVHSVKPKTVDTQATPEPTDAPEPTKEPEPITIWENQFNQNATTFEARRTSGADWLTDLSNDAIIQFTYTSTEEVDPDSGIWDIYGGNNEWNKCASLTACAGSSTKSTDVQVVQLTIGDLKDILGVGKDKDIDYLILRPYNYYCPHARMLSVKLYGADYSGNYDTGGSGDSKDANTEVVKKKDVFNDDDTHIIYFTPHEGNVKGSIIKSFMIQFTGMDNEKEEAISLPVTTIYRSLGDGEYQKITSPEGQPGQFNEILVDGRQYFITYDKENVSNLNPKTFNKLEMYIQNDRKESKTILSIIPTAEQKADSEEVYMFNLD